MKIHMAWKLREYCLEGCKDQFIVIKESMNVPHNMFMIFSTSGFKDKQIKMDKVKKKLEIIVYSKNSILQL